VLAMWIHFRRPEAAQLKRAALAVIGFALVGSVAGHVAHVSILVEKSMVSLIFTASIMLALSVPWFSRALSIKPLTVTGRVSYCMYLTHVVIAKMILFAMPGKALPLAAFRCGMILAVSYGVAILSWRFLEEPILAYKKYFQGDRPAAVPSGLPVPSGLEA
jgi:peptidoglycan/LPS O-acetylase OafA/YrhL